MINSVNVLFSILFQNIAKQRQNNFKQKMFYVSNIFISCICLFFGFAIINYYFYLFISVFYYFFAGERWREKVDLGSLTQGGIRKIIVVVTKQLELYFLIFSRLNYIFCAKRGNQEFYEIIDETIFHIFVFFQFYLFCHKFLNCFVQKNI